MDFGEASGHALQSCFQGLTTRKKHYKPLTLNPYGSIKSFPKKFYQVSIRFYFARALIATAPKPKLEL